MPQYDLLLEHVSYVESFATGTMHTDCFIAIKDGVVVAIGDMQALAPDCCATQRIDASPFLIIPGLINCHNHSSMTLFRGLADDLPLMTWLQDFIFPAEAQHVDGEMVYWCTKLAAAEMILSGTTLVADGYFHEEAAARAFRDVGIRGIAAQGIIDFPAPGVADPGENIYHARQFIEGCRSGSALVTPGVFCHSPYTCSAQTIIAAKQLALQAEVPFFIHVSETKQELNECLTRHGKTPVAYLDSLGVLGRQTILVHGVWLTDDDITLISQRGAKVVSCPKSNMKLASGVAPLTKLLDARVAVGIGTDGVASNNSLDLFSELASCARLHKVKTLEATAMPASVLLAMATAGGAEVLGMGAQVGAINVGMQADLVCVNLQRPHLTPFYNLENLVYAGRGDDIDTVIVDGRLVLQGRRFVSFDLVETLARVRGLAAKVRR